MGNITDFLSWRGDLSFDNDELNEADLVALSLLPILDFTSCIKDNEIITLNELVKRYHSPSLDKPKLLGLIIPIETVDVIDKIANSARYKDLYVSDYKRIIDKEKYEQFSALTLSYKEKYTFVIFAPTDDSITGWLENFSAMFKNFSEASKDAIKYLDDASKKAKGKLIVLGYSKGGNLSYISTLLSSDETFNRIEKTYLIDGQGIPNINELDDKILKRNEKIFKFLPNSSIIGRLFNYNGEYKIVASIEKGLHQHISIYWVLEGKNLKEEKEFTKESESIKELVDSTLMELSTSERIKLFNIFKDILDKNDINSLLELKEKLTIFIKECFKINSDDKKIIRKVSKRLLKNKEFRSTAIYDIIRELRNGRRNNNGNN